MQNAEENPVKKKHFLVSPGSFLLGFCLAAFAILSMSFYFDESPDDLFTPVVHEIDADIASDYVRSYRTRHIFGKTSFLVRTKDLLELLRSDRPEAERPEYLHIFFGREKLLKRRTLILAGAVDRDPNDNRPIYENTFLPARTAPTVLQHVIPCKGSDCILTYMRDGTERDTTYMVRKFPNNKE